MKRFVKSVLGITLLEIMLVLAIAAMIIMMSIRYYQSANASQEATNVLQQLQAIAAAADSLSQGSGSYSTATSANVLPLLTGAGLNTPWGTQISLSNQTTTGYSVTVPGTPTAVCPLVWGRLNGDAHYTGLTACNSTGTTDLSYTYNPNP